MRASLKKAIIPVAILVGMALCTMSSSLLYWGNLIITSHPNNFDDEDIYIEEEPLYSFPLFDTYDAGGGSLSEFMEREGVLDDLISINDELNANEKFVYYQISEPSVYYMGKYTGKDSTIVGGEEYRNQLDNSGNNITSLNTLEVSQYAYEKIPASLKSGRPFSSEDFTLTYESKIPVIVGNDYEDFLSVGDEFQIQYYMKTIKAEVIGILEKNSEIYLPNFSMLTDGYMVFPNIGIVPEEEDSYFHNTIMMLEKNEGYIGVRHLDDFPEVISEIEKISDKYNFSYSVDSIKNMYEYIKTNEFEKVEVIENDDDSKEVNNQLSEAQKVLLRISLFSGTILIIFGLLLWYERIKKSDLKGEKPVIYKTKRVLELVAAIIGSYFVSYIVSLKILAELYDNRFFKESIYYPQGIMRLLIITVIIIMGIIICKNVNKKVREEKDD